MKNVLVLCRCPFVFKKYLMPLLQEMGEEISVHLLRIVENTLCKECFYPCTQYAPCQPPRYSFFMNARLIKSVKKRQFEIMIASEITSVVSNTCYAFSYLLCCFSGIPRLRVVDIGNFRSWEYSFRDFLSYVLSPLFKICLELVDRVVSGILRKIFAMHSRSQSECVIMVDPTGSLGDIVIDIPTLRELRNQHPTTSIILIVSNHRWKDLAWSEFLYSIPYIDDFYILDAAKPLYLNIWKLGQKLRTSGRMHVERIILLKRYPRLEKLLSSFLTGERQLEVSSVPPKWNEKGPDVSISEIELRLSIVTKRWKECREARDLLACKLFEPSAEAKAEVESFLAQHQVEQGEFLIGILPGSASNVRSWPADNYVQLSNELLQRYKSRIVILGNPHEVEECEKIANRVQTTPILAAGRLGIGHLLAFVRKLYLLIGGDSGPIHIAAAVGTPTVTIFGPSSWQLWGWYSIDPLHKIVKPPPEVICAPCGFMEGCPLNKCRCMEAIRVPEVLQVVEELIPKCFRRN